MRVFPKLLGTFIALGSALLCLPTLAQTNAPLAEGAAAEAGVQSTARLAGIFGSSCEKIRTRGVGLVKHPATGICCIKPKARTHLDVTRIVPIVTVDWGQSSGNDLMAFFSSELSECTAGYIEIRRYDLTGTLTDRAGFTVTVP